MNADLIVHIETLRHVGKSPQRYTLFQRQHVDWEYLLRLSAAGVLKIYGLAETSCTTNQETGEITCTHVGSPKLDCRQKHCRYAHLMRMRLVSRLSKAYARERNKLKDMS